MASSRAEGSPSACTSARRRRCAACATYAGLATSGQACGLPARTCVTDFARRCDCISLTGRWPSAAAQSGWPAAAPSRRPAPAPMSRCQQQQQAALVRGRGGATQQGKATRSSSDALPRSTADPARPAHCPCRHTILPTAGRRSWSPRHVGRVQVGASGSAGLRWNSFQRD